MDAPEETTISTSRVRRSVGTNVSSVFAGIIDVALFLISLALMITTLVAALEKWPGFWWLSVVLALLPVVLIVTVVWTTKAAVEDQPGSHLSWRSFKRGSFYLVLPLLANLIIAVMALAFTLTWFLVG